MSTAGFILNDNDLEVDQLSRVVYAETLVQQIKSIKSPIAIGLFAKWGSGKSFLLKQFQSRLISLQEERTQKQKKKTFNTVVQICFAITVVVLLGLAIAAFVSDAITFYVGIALLLIIFLALIVWFVVGKRGSVNTKPSIGLFKVIFYALFTKLPIRKNKFPKIPVTSEDRKKFMEELWEERVNAKKNKNKQRFIFVNYNAWQYVGCDFLWAGIVTTLAEAIENEFGVFTTRLFRSLSLDPVEDTKKNSKNSFRKHLKNYPRISYLVALLGAVILFIASAALLIYILINDQTGGVAEGTLVDEILVFLPAGITVLFGILRSLYALYNSHKNNVTKALQGAKKDFANELGFMEKIRNEIQSMIDLVHTVELSSDVEYTVIITIDDLDRIPLPKVKSVLEAVNILLSDRHSPFICIIAVDLRIACDCFAAAKKNKNKILTSVNGYEYLKKIINLPFCLHEIDDETKSSRIRALAEEWSNPKKRSRIPEKPNPPKVVAWPTSTSIKLQWDDVTGDAKKTYTVIQNEKEVLTGLTTNEATIDKLTLNTSYQFQIKATNAAGDGEISEPTRTSTLFLEWINSTKSSIKMKVKDAYATNQNTDDTPPNTYQIFKDGDRCIQPVIDTSKDMQTVKNLTPNTNYRFQVKRINDGGKVVQESDEHIMTTKTKFDLKFLRKCRKVMCENKKEECLKNFMMGNPRNLKRIFNIISMTACWLNVIQEHKRRNSLQETDNYKDINSLTAEELSHWIVLTEQWPFRLSYILVMIDIYDQQNPNMEEFNDKTPLINIYHRFTSVEAEAKPFRAHENLLPLDCQEITLENFLDSYSKLLTVGTAKRMWRYTINLDSNIKKSISLVRDRWIKFNLQKEEEKK